MANGKSVSIQVVLKKVEDLEARVKRMEKDMSVGIVRLSDKEMAEIRKIKKEILTLYKTSLEKYNLNPDTGYFP